ncbi:MAG: cupredoxin domain-containing protein [Thermoleophilaceae bacterium]
MTVSSFAFTPADITVAQGEKVTWNNTGGTHNVKFNDGNFEMPSQPSSMAWTVQRTFDAAGEFTYYCEEHSGVMTGIVRVTATTPPPGGGGGGGGGYGGGPAGVAPGSGRPAPAEVSGDNPAAIAESLMGVSAAELIRSGVIPMDNVPTDVCCANFVTAVLQKAGWIDWHSNSVSSGELESKLKADGWREVTVSEAKPGDVVISNGGGHVVMVGDGDPAYIGSNNVNPDGSQSVSAGGEGGMVKILQPPPGVGGS